MGSVDGRGSAHDGEGSKAAVEKNAAHKAMQCMKPGGRVILALLRQTLAQT
jgi:hypothetical protein